MSVKPGVVTADKMRELVVLSIKLTLDKNQRKIDSLLALAGALEYVAMSWSCPDLHIKQFLDKNHKSVEEIPEIQRRCIRLAARCDTSGLVFFDLWRELGQAVRELMCANYDSIPRSLRWMIEACVFWADMQLDGDSAKEMFEHFWSQRSKLTKREFDRVFIEIFRLDEERLAERLRFKEKYRGPSIGEIMNNLSVLKNRPGKYEGHRLRDSITAFYKESSGYAHATLSTFEEIQMEPGELHRDFAFFQDYRYDEERFEVEFRNICTAIDLVITIMILVETEFFGYGTPHEFFEHLGDIGNEVASKVQRLRDSFPFTNSIITAG